MINNNIREAINNEMQLSKTPILTFPWEKPEAYAMWLAQTYHMVCYSTRIVALAGALTDLSQETLHNRFVDHAKEERGHPQLCINDLKAMGKKIEDYPKLPEALAMYQTQYFWLERKDPASFYGYGLALECLAANFGRELHSAVKEAHGPKASQFLRVHAEEDDGHVESSFVELDKLNDFQKECIAENLTISSHLYRSMLSEIVKQTEKTNTIAA